MLVLLAVGGITCVVWGRMLWLSFLDETGRITEEAREAQQDAVRDGGG